MTKFYIRGGEQPIFGVYVGGDALTSNYKLASPNSYSSTFQLCSKKGLQVVKSALHSQRINTTSLQFNRKLDVTEDHSESLSEFNIESFLRAVRDIVEHFDLDTFVYVIDSDMIMKHLLEEPHKFTLSAVIKRHASRLVDPDSVI